jgi:hypothetical protein
MISPCSTAHRAEPLGAIFLRFLKFGCLVWSGPAALIAMIKLPRRVGRSESSTGEALESLWLQVRAQSACSACISDT